MNTSIYTSCRVAVALITSIALTAIVPAAPVFASQGAEQRSKTEVKSQSNDQSKDEGKKLGHQRKEAKQDQPEQPGKADNQEKPSDKATGASAQGSNNQTKTDQPVAAQAGVTAAKSNGPSDSQKNHERYWEALGYGVCYKYDNLSTKVFTVPAPASGKVYSVAIVKAGSSSSVANPNEVDETVASGDTLRHSSGKDISHIILCTKPAGVVTSHQPVKDVCPDMPGTQKSTDECKKQANPEKPGKTLSSETKTPVTHLPAVLPSTGMAAVMTVMTALCASAVAYVGTRLMQKSQR